MRIKFLFVLITLGVISTYCKTNLKQKTTLENAVAPDAIIYKTKNDYYNLVPITLTTDKKKIVSYPHPNDLKSNGDYTLPTTLINGYLLDNRGINVNSVFLSITYEEYAKLQEAPTIEYLLSHIRDERPFLEMYSLGQRNKYKNISNEIKAIIKKGQLSNYSNYIKN
jgi:hypothetical protein